ncbi:AprI/Inh family metalloprotease inhibitor [Bosea sp. R86505]|uniref:AprI/Inh family metalloprotease inhibitor n=1 Tax=Bosea sp. R86505 TaxID=3101710 RepID=UPI00366C447B
MPGALRCALAAGGLVLSGLAAAAQTAPPPRGADRAPPAVAQLLGAWDLEQTGAPRRCTVTLGVEETAGGRQLRFPATCRRALPLLADVTSWSLGPDGAPRLNGADGKAVLAFGQQVPTGFSGRARDGRDYALNRGTHPRVARRPAPSPAEVAATAAQRPTQIDPSRAPAAATLPGLYALMRQQGREACRLRLVAPTAEGEAADARLERPCPDTGITIFDPTTWRYAGGRLTLIARKGHSIDLVFEAGVWRKDPAVGATLLLRRLQP